MLDTKCVIDDKRIKSSAYRYSLPTEKVKWTIQAKAVQTGDSRLKVYMYSEIFKPIAEEESTHIYENDSQ